eukprot:514405_1
MAIEAGKAIHKAVKKGKEKKRRKKEEERKKREHQYGKGRVKVVKRREYQGHRHGKDFNSAEIYCKTTFRGHLASIVDDKENSIVQNFCNTMGQGWACFVGLKHPFRRWTDMTTVGYERWAPGEPRPTGKCAEIRTRDSKWDTVACNARRAFICQKNTNKRLGPARE